MLIPILSCGCFCAIMAEWSSCDRNHVVCKAENIYLSGPLQKKFAIPCFQILMWQCMIVFGLYSKGGNLFCWYFQQVSFFFKFFYYVYSNKFLKRNNLENRYFFIQVNSRSNPFFFYRLQRTWNYQP